MNSDILAINNVLFQPQMECIKINVSFDYHLLQNHPFILKRIVIKTGSYDLSRLLHDAQVE